MVILHVFLVWSQEASGKLAIQRVTSRSLCAVQPGEVVQISWNSRADFLGSAHLGLKMCPRVHAAASTRRLMFSSPYLVCLPLLQGPLMVSAAPPGIASCSADPGDKHEGQERVASNQCSQGSAPFHPLQAGKGVSDLRGMFQAMPTLSRLGATKACWVSLIFRLDFLSVTGRVNGVLALPDTCCYGIGI